MKYLSLFSGIEAATVAFEPLGWEPVGLSEVEDFCNELLKQRFPHIPNYGDINDYRTWPNLNPDLLIGGSPCQSFSTSGNREGLDDPRGRLLYSYIQVVERYNPEWIIWENVKGVLHQGKGRAFGALLGELAELGYTLGWRLLDARRFTPQSRPRVFLVGHRGDRPEPVASVLALGEGESIHNTSGDISEEERPWLGSSSSPIVSTVTKNYHKGVHCGGETYVQMSGVPDQLEGSELRQMMPEEIERLFGFPTGWTAIKWNKRIAPKTRRYKALGNSMSVPVLHWLASRINDVHLSKQDV